MNLETGCLRCSEVFVVAEEREWSRRACDCRFTTEIAKPIRRCVLNVSCLPLLMLVLITSLPVPTLAQQAKPKNLADCLVEPALARQARMAEAKQAQAKTQEAIRQVKAQLDGAEAELRSLEGSKPVLKATWENLEIGEFESEADFEKRKSRAQSLLRREFERAERSWRENFATKKVKVEALRADAESKLDGLCKAAAQAEQAIAKASEPLTMPPVPHALTHRDIILPRFDRHELSFSPVAIAPIGVIEQRSSQPGTVIARIEQLDPTSLRITLPSLEAAKKFKENFATGQCKCVVALSLELVEVESPVVLQPEIVKEEETYMTKGNAGRAATRFALGVLAQAFGAPPGQASAAVLNDPNLQDKPERRRVIIQPQRQVEGTRFHYRVSITEAHFVDNGGRTVTDAAVDFIGDSRPIRGFDDDAGRREDMPIDAEPSKAAPVDKLAPIVEVSKLPSPIRATDYCSLPTVPPATQSKEESSVLLKRLEHPVGEARLALYGLAELNARFHLTGKLIQTSNGYGDLVIALRRYETGFERHYPLAEFNLEGHELAFKWLKTPLGETELDLVPRLLPLCVLQVDAGETIEYLALSPPVLVAPLAIGQGVALIDNAALVAKAAFPPVLEDRLYLDRGIIVATDDSLMQFSKTALGEDLVMNKGTTGLLAGVELGIALEAAKESPSKRQIIIDVRRADSDRERQELIDAKERLLKSIRPLYEKLKSEDEGMADKVSIVESLASLLGIANPPQPPRKPIGKAWENYRYQVKRRVGDRASAKTRSLPDEIKRLKAETPKSVRVLDKLSSVTAVLCRLVDDSVEVDAVVFGEALKKQEPRPR